MDSERFEISISLGDVSFQAAGKVEPVMSALEGFKDLVASQPRASQAGLGRAGDRINGDDSQPAANVPLAIFVKRPFSSQAAKATAIVLWARDREGKSGLKPSEIEAYWRKTQGKVPANPSQVCASAVAQGWLHNEGNGVYSITGHGEAMVTNTQSTD